MKKLTRLWLKQFLALVPTVFLMIGLTISYFNIVPPLGNLLQPVNGMYQTLDDGEYPQSMTITDPSIKEKVIVYRDEYGVPHIYAENIDDMFFAEGYIMARDRLFEMDVLRRFSSGRLAELIPMINIPSRDLNLDPNMIAGIDAYFRYLGINTVGENLIDRVMVLGEDSVEFRAVKRYTEGVNLAIKEMILNRDLPISYILLNTQPEEWTYYDCGYVYALITFAMGLKSKDLDHTAMAETLGEYIKQHPEKYKDEGFSVLFPETNGSLPYENPVIPNNFSIFPQEAPSSSSVPSSIPRASQESAHDDLLTTISFLTQLDQLVHDLLGLKLIEGTLEASNNWVVAGSRTVSGKPIVCNDPHLLIMQPSVFYEVHLVCKDNGITNVKGKGEPLNVHGVAMPGEPLIVIGFNERVSWGITNFASDSLVDYYYEVLNKEGTQYYYNGSWHDLKIEEQTIHVRKGDDLKITIRKTIHGPIITDCAGLGPLGALVDTSNPDEGHEQNGTILPISMCWVALKPIPEGKNMFTSIYRLMAAYNLTDFKQAMKEWSVPAMNVVFGDIEGNIALYVPGLHPVRGINGTYKPEYTGSFIQPGDGTGQEWIGWIPDEQVPHSINPAQGYLTSANQRTIAAKDYTYSVGRDWTWGNYRARRINEVLNSSWNITVEDMMRLQADIKDLSAARITPYLLKAIENMSLTGDFEKARELLTQWNLTYPGEMRKELIAPTIYHYFFKLLLKNVWDDEWHAANATGHYPSPQYLEYMIREKPSSVWFDNVETENIETRDDILRKTFIETVQYISEHLGNLTEYPEKWLYGKNFKLLLISSFEMIDLALKGSAGYAYDGSEFTVDAAAGFGEFPTYVYGGPAWRHIIDFGDPSHPLTVIPPGNSANMFSKHWDDQRDLFINNQYKKPCRAANPEEFFTIQLESTITFESGSSNILYIRR